jgi:hypothetical protein
MRGLLVSGQMYKWVCSTAFQGAVKGFLKGELLMGELRKERGMTVIGWLIVLALIAFSALLALRLVPVYLGYYNVASILEGVAHERLSPGTARQEILKRIERRMEINDVKDITPQDIIIKEERGVTTVTADYEVRVPILANIDAVISFHKSVQLVVGP